MKTGSKVVMGVLAALLMLCAASGVALFVSGAGQKIRGFATGVVQVAGEAKGLDALNRKHPFSPPANGEVSEARLEAYIRACQELKPESDQYEAWFRAHEHQGRGQGNFTEAGEAVGLVGGVMKAMAMALESQSMGPQEFHWIRRTMRKAQRDTAGRQGSALEHEMLEALQQVASAPGLDGGARKRLESEIQSFRKQISEGIRPLTANDELYLRYAGQLAACELGEETLSLVGGFEGGPRGEGRGGIAHGGTP